MDILDQLTEQESVLRLLLDNMYDCVYIVDIDRRIIYWNRSSEELTGYTRDEVMGKRCSENILNHIDQNGMLLCRGACPIVKVMQSGAGDSFKVYPRKKNGTRFPVETVISPVFDHAGKIIASIEVYRDISLQEEHRILQEKFNNLIRKYVSTTTYSDVLHRIKQDDNGNVSRVLDLSVLYLDIVDFTTFSETTNPDAVVAMLNDLFGICEVITKEFYGDIDKFIGDAMMAVFADANDAVSSALKILHTGLPEMNRIRRSTGETEINIRIGINSGKVLQGDIGTADRKDLTVIGDTVNIAARLEKSSQPNHLLISEATLSRIEPDLHAQFGWFDTLELKGKLEPINSFINKIQG